MNFKGISKDSRMIKKGYVYACFEGEHVSGYDYINDAIKNGAQKIIGEKDINLDIYEKVENVNDALIKYAREIYDYPEKNLNLIGITGTDGKTTTALIIKQLLNKYSKTSYLGTNGFYIGDEEINYNGFTTPFADELYLYLNKAVKKKSTNFVMEVSSHALKQERVKGLDFKVGIFTNLGEEHLDFHENMEDYYCSKKRLFKMISKEGVAIINTDDSYGSRLYQELQEEIIDNYKIISVGTKGKDYKIEIIEETLDGNIFKLIDFFDKKEYIINTKLLAKFNIYNLTQALIAGKFLGYKIEDILKEIAIINIPGRLEVIKKRGYPRVIIDFAHTKEAIEKVMNFINTQKKADEKIWTLTGSAGQRDAQKRPGMGNAVTKFADFTIFTEDDPRDESVQEIIQDLKKGINNKNVGIFEILKRKEAIRFAIETASEKDTIILFGKGSMQLMYYNNYTEAYSERKEVEKVLKEDK